MAATITPSTSSSGAVASKVVEFGDRLEYALNVVQEVRKQTGLSAQDFLKHLHLTEGQQNILLVLARNEALPPSEVARQVGGDIGTADHDLAVLSEHGLV